MSQRRCAATVVGFAVALSTFGAAPAEAVTMQLRDAPGWAIYEPLTGSIGWRYGPSIIINADDSIDMWTTMPASQQGTWDDIGYRRSTDGGRTWTADQIAIRPTPGSGSLDAKSTADPGVIKLGSYYYLGYTSTTDPDGMLNSLFVARSTSPGGPYEKWNGTGWGGLPKPIVRYDAQGPSDKSYGIGEPSFVEKDGTLFLYYTYLDDVRRINETRVATALVGGPSPLYSRSWPGGLVLKGTAITREPGGRAIVGNSTIAEDSTDIKYVDALGKWIGVSTGRRMYGDSYLAAYESTDGLRFTPMAFSNEFTQLGAHNVGLSGTGNGHYDTADANFVAYAVGGNATWGSWDTYLNPVRLDNQAIGLSYSTYVTNVGWMPAGDNRVSGLAPGYPTEPMVKYVQALRIGLTNAPSGMFILGQASVQGSGWQPLSLLSNDSSNYLGTTGRGLRLEALQLRLTGAPPGYHVKYRLYLTGRGWGPWATDGRTAGTPYIGQAIDGFQAMVYRD